ncbi:MAG: sigma-70 family RNA polymerase sigma factor, partial [Butyricimonas faecihominis]
CVQNANFSAWERRNKFDSVYTFKAFLYMAIKNDIISIHRKNSARERYVRELEDVSCFANSVIDQEAQTLLYSAIEELPEKARIVFEMSFMEGLKNVEIAEKLGLSVMFREKIQGDGLGFLA